MTPADQVTTLAAAYALGAFAGQPYADPYIPKHGGPVLTGDLAAAAEAAYRAGYAECAARVTADLRTVRGQAR